ncbi:MAG: 30S ribosomal protein S6, partial [Patescibacteria group bacterium]|nr:30S ribosomal protein S6 [Patescibacteria group bacterium]
EVRINTFLEKESDIKIIKDIIDSLKGKIEKEEKWGEKTLAYPIGKNKKAFYFHFLISIEKKNVKQLKQKLNFETKVIRYLILLVNN